MTRLCVLGAIVCANVAACGSEPSGRKESAAEGCRERRTAMAPSQMTPAGFPPQAVLGFLEGRRTAELTWPDGKKTQVAYQADALKSYFVQSEPDPDFHLDIAVQCKDFVLFEGPVQLGSDDGQLDERWTAARIRATSAERADLVLTVKRADMRGKYEPLRRTTECVSALQFNVGFTPSVFSGNLLDTVARVPCSQVKDTTGVSPRTAGSWGAGM